MARRIGFLCVAVLTCGVASWWCLSSPIRGGEDEPTPAEAAPAKPEASAPMALERHRANEALDYKRLSPAEQKIQAALNDPQGVDIEFIDTPLKDGMEFLADSAEITIIIDEAALSEAGIATDEPLNRILSGIPLKNVMNVLFEPLGLTYVIEDDVLKVTTQSAEVKRRVVKVYNVAPLQATGLQPAALSETLKKILAQPKEPPTKIERDAEKRWLILRDEQGGIVAVRNQATGEAIFDFNSSHSTIDAIGGLLVVSAPRSAHEKIQEVLHQLYRGWDFQQAPAKPK